MAILPSLPGVTVSIICDGQALPEYDCEDLPLITREDHGIKSLYKPAHEIAKYVQAKAGTEFFIRFEVAESQHQDSFTYVVTVIPDGTPSRPHYNSLGGSLSIRGVRTSAGMMNFRFSDLETCDSYDAPRFNGFGCIAVTLRRSHVVTTSETGGKHHIVELPETIAVPEKALKGQALSVRTSFSTPIPYKPRVKPVVDCKYVDAKSSPFAMFYFKYGSKRDLQVLGVIPRSPSPVLVKAELKSRSGTNLKVETMSNSQNRLNSRKRKSSAVVKTEGSDLTFISAKRCRPVANLKNPIVIDSDDSNNED